jgi:Tol biopolymer transport system component
VWSPDGTRIAFFDVNASEVFIFEPDKPWDGQELVKLPRPPAPMLFFNPSDWSPDGLKLVGTANNGAAVYSFASRRYEQTTPPLRGRPVWLPDSRRLVSAAAGKLYVFDSASGKSTELLSVAPDNIAEVAVSHDGRRIWFARGSTEGDIWMATLK